MNVTSVSSISSLLQASSVQSTQDVSDLTELGGTESTGVSKMADLMSQLQSLKESDPDKFKKVMEAISEQLQKQADAAADGKAGFLSDLAARFKEAGESGDLSVLKPPAPPEGQQAPPPPDKVRAAYARSSAESPVDALAQLIQSTLDQYGS